MDDKYLLFRLVPTMNCNFRCSYCFLSSGEKAVPGTLFDIHSPREWIAAMKNFKKNKVEFYCWGGEPFLLDGTYELVKGWAEYDHVISGSRLDTNMAFAEKIAQRCPTDKVKLNCSWHAQYFSLDTIYNKVRLLNDIGMVGMLNFVASDDNLKRLDTDYRMSVHDLIKKFADIGVFVNIAADFSRVNDKDPSTYVDYKKFLMQFTNPDDWKHLRSDGDSSLCTSNKHFFTLQPNGDITPCLSNQVCGNFFDGTLRPPELSVCNKICPSIVAYPFRTDNNFIPAQHLVRYVNRNREYRESLSRMGKIFDLCLQRIAPEDTAPVCPEPSPSISVILPTYNQVRYLPRIIDSLLTQSWEDFELIIVNDGSTDTTKEYLDTLTDSRVTVIHQTNMRLPSALNCGFKNARGEFLTWVSSDNYCAPTFLETLRSGFSTDPEAGFAYSAFAWINETDQITGIHRDQDVSWPNLIKCNPGIAAFMYRRECQDSVGCYDPELEGAEDWDMWLRILERYPAVYLPETLYYYRLHDDSMTATKRELIDASSRKTILKAFTRHNGKIPLEKYYPSLGGCRDHHTAETVAYLDLGTKLLISPNAPAELALPFLETAYDRAPSPLHLWNLALCYGKMGRWSDLEICRSKLSANKGAETEELCSALATFLKTKELPTPLPVYDPSQGSNELFEMTRRSRKQGAPLVEGPLVSVIVPTFDRPEMLREALRSILQQTFQDFEVIVVNDAGRDVSSVVDALASPKISYLPHDSNKGLAAARNSGIRAAKGKYIAYLDDDDLYYPDHLETLVTFLEGSDEKVAYCDSYRAFQKKVDGRYEVVGREIAHGIDFDYDRILVDNFVPVLCFMHEKRCLEESGSFDETLLRHEDWDLWIRMSRKFRFAHIPKITSEFSSRVDGNNMTTGTVPMFFATKSAIYAKYRELASPDVQRQQRANLWDFMQNFLYVFLEEKVAPLVPLFMAGKTTRGEAQLAELAATGATPAQRESALADQLALAYLKDGATDDAMTQFERAVAADGMNPVACHNLAAMYRIHGRSEDSARVYRDIIRRNESEIPSLVALAELATERGDLTEAHTRYSQVLTLEPGNRVATEALAGLPLPGSETVSADRTKIAVYSLDAPEFACAHLRLIAPTEALTDSVELRWGANHTSSQQVSIDTSLAAWADLIIIQRFFPMPHTISQMERILAAGKPIIYETDDLVMEVPTTNPHQKGADAATPYILDLIAKAAAVTVSTEEMKRAFAHLHKEIHILPNLLDQRLWSAPITAKPPHAPVVIGYAGTPDHKADLHLLEEVLERISAKYGNRVAFCFMGCYTERIRRLPGFSSFFFEPGYANYAETIQQAGIDIGLVPLEDNRFNRCKSNIKWLEYSVCGIAGVYSDLPPYAAVNQGETGILVQDSPQAWFDALEDLICHPEKRKRIARQAREEVLKNYTVRSKAHLYLETYRHIMADSRSGEKTPKFSIIISSCNRAEMLERCLASLHSTLSDPGECEIIVGNNGSTDDTEAVLERYPMQSYLRVSKGIGEELYRNLLDLARGEYLVILRDDVIDLPPRFDRALEDAFTSHPDYGFLSLDVVRNRFTAGGKAGLPGDHDDRRDDITVREGEVIGCCSCIKRDTFHRIGRLDNAVLGTHNPVERVIAGRLRQGEARTGILKDVKCFHACAPAYATAYGNPGEAVAPPVKVSIIIPLFNKVDYTRQCLEALERSTPNLISYELILVNNGSTDGTAEYLGTLTGNVTIITNSSNLGFARACNQGGRIATSEYLVFLNNDTLPKPGWLEALLDGIEQDGADICGARLLYPDGKVQHAGVAFNEDSIGYHIFNGFHANSPAVTRKRFMQCVTAACMMLRRELFTTLSGFDEGYVNGYEDVDFCLRAGALDKKILYVPESTLIHFEESSEGRKSHEEPNARRYLNRWGGRVLCDDNDYYHQEGYSKEELSGGRVRLTRVGARQPDVSNPIKATRQPLRNNSISERASNLIQQGVELKTERRYAEALELFTAAGNEGERSAPAHRGDCLANLGRFEESEAAYREALRVSSEELIAHTGIGVLKLLTQGYPAAATAFGKALQIDPHDSKALCGLGMARMGEGRAAIGSSYFKKALEIDPENITALSQLIHCAYQLGSYDQAIGYLNSYLMYHPGDKDMLYSQAGLLHKAGKQAEALEQLERLLALHPDYEGGEELRRKIVGEANPSGTSSGKGGEHTALGRQLKEQGEYARALDSFSRASERGELSALVEMGDCLARLGRLDEATEQYRKALQHDRSSVKALIGLGVTSLLTARQEEAESWFRKALAIEPADSQALTGLGMIRAQQDRQGEAFDTFASALEGDPENLTALTEHLRIAYATERLPEAEPFLKKYLMYHPADNHILYSLAGLLYRTGKLEEAGDILERILTFEPEYEGGKELKELVAAALPGEENPAGKPALSTPSNRVMIACSHFWPSIGGMETIVEQLAANLVDAGYEVDIMTSAFPGRNCDSYFGARIISLDLRATRDGVPEWLLRIKEGVTSGVYKACILIQAPTGPIIRSMENVIIPPQTRLIIQPIINADVYATWRDDEEFRSRLGAILRNAASAVAMTRDGLDVSFMNSVGVPPRYIPNAVSITKPYGDFRAEHGVGVDDFLILHVANLYRVKNHVALMGTLTDLPPQWRLVMIGHPWGDPEAAEQFLQELPGHPELLYIPGLPKEKISAAMAAADVVLLASLGEGSPVTILEAMAQGKPWLATPTCGAVHDNAGGIIAPLAEFRENLQLLHDNPEIRLALGGLGHAHWEECFSWPVVIKGWIDLIETGILRDTFDMPPAVARKGRELKVQMVSKLGSSLTRLGRLTEATEQYKKALQHHENDIQALVGLGVTNLLNNKLVQAVTWFNRALKVDPADSQALAGLGMARVQQGKQKEAFDLFTAALGSDPEHLVALNELLRIAYEQERLSEAEPFLRRYLTHNPVDRHLLYSLAGLLYRSGKLTEARDTLCQVLALEPAYEGGPELEELIANALNG